MNGKTGAGWDRIFDSLAHDTRRAILNSLVEQQGNASFEEVVALLATSLPEKSREQHSCSCHHVHLPKLDEAELVVWDQDTDRIELTELGDSLPVRVLVRDSPSASQILTQEKIQISD